MVPEVRPSPLPISPLSSCPLIWSLQLLKCMWIQHHSLSLPNSPHSQILCLGAVSTLTPTHLLCHLVCGKIASLLTPVAQPTQGGNTPSCPQWSLLLWSPFPQPHISPWIQPFCGILPYSPTLPPSPWNQWTHPFVRKTHAVAGS